MKIEHKNLVGIGIGPSNLSLAALSYPLDNFSSIFFDKQKSFEWHKGMEIPNAKLQVSYLKDLVTLIDPSNPLSFLSFLSSKKRLYQFINADFQKVSRCEFSQYYQWTCKILSEQLMFDSEVNNIELQKDQLLVETKNKKILTQAVVLGHGLLPYVPAFANNLLCDNLYHSSQFMNNSHQFKNKRIAIIGGGQSSAEIILYILSKSTHLPKNLTWISRRDNFLPLDDSPFVNDLFTPEYSNYFYHQSDTIKQTLIRKQKLFSDGISNNTLNEIYKQLYELKYIKQAEICNLYPESEVTGILKNNTEWCLQIVNKYKQNKILLNADIVILCTGYQYQLPNFLTNLLDRIDRDTQGNLIINKDFSLNWDGPAHCNLYVQNGALHCRGIADPNLSLIPWRSATILNSINKRQIYDVDNNHSFFNWNHTYVSKK